MNEQASLDTVSEGGWGPGIVSLLKCVDEVDAWLRSLGFDPDRTRFGAYAEVFRRSAVQAPAVMPHEQGKLAIEAIVPYLELLDVKRHLAPIVDGNSLKARLERMLEGPALEEDESADDGTSDARNLGFELVVGAALAEGGARVVLPDDGDLTAKFNGATAAIECKRVQSITGIRRCVKRGGEQLAVRSGLQFDSLRLVAVDISLVIRSASSVFAYPTHEAVWNELKARTDNVQPKIESTCERVQGPRTHGVILFVSALTHVTDEGFWGCAGHRSLLAHPERFAHVIRKAFKRFLPAVRGHPGVRRPW